MNVVIVDNYDSFTYNLKHSVEYIIQRKVDVLYNDSFEICDLDKYDKIILSPGPGLPKDAGNTLAVIDYFKNSKSILGVCLGLQSIGVAFDCKLKNLESVFHGIETDIFTTIYQSCIFNEIAMPTKVGRYHSWVIDENFVNENLLITAIDEDKNIMAAKHKFYDVEGVQFHPESIMTTQGNKMLANWLLK